MPSGLARLASIVATTLLVLDLNEIPSVEEVGALEGGR